MFNFKNDESKDVTHSHDKRKLRSKKEEEDEKVLYWLHFESSNTLRHSTPLEVILRLHRVPNVAILPLVSWWEFVGEFEAER
ncbi:hypothetical protein E2C01_000204 [Portunus trituberculatus]|uniref:Uncharacterized protein n=1 Tax=Portunus trituberculatus TaxID=210409 RepID=A0A5B7CFX4_PORTR|nr:hypothetical protein [Portunus trituberculatus]